MSFSNYIKTGQWYLFSSN